MKKRFGLKEIILGSFLASTGCAGEEVEAKGQQDGRSDTKIIQKQDSIQPENDSIEDFLITPDDTIDSDILPKTEENNEVSDIFSDKEDEEVKKVKEKIDEIDVGGADEQNSGKYNNFLFEEIENFSNNKNLIDFDVKKESKRITPKLAEEYSKKMFNHLPVLMERYFKKLIKDADYKEELNRLVKKYCEEYNVPVSVAMGVIGVESGGNNSLVSNRDAYGVFQIKQIAADHLKKIKFNNKNWDGIRIGRLEDNVRVGIAYMSYLHNRYGQWGLSLMAYNTGPTNFENSVIKRLNKYNRKVYRKRKKKSDLVEKVKRFKRKEIRDYPGGWTVFLQDNGVNMISACSKNGLKMCERGYGSYPFEAMFLSQTVKEILETKEDEIELKNITENF